MRIIKYDLVLSLNDKFIKAPKDSNIIELAISSIKSLPRIKRGVYERKFGCMKCIKTKKDRISSALHNDAVIVFIIIIVFLII